LSHAIVFIFARSTTLWFSQLEKNRGMLRGVLSHPPHLHSTSNVTQDYQPYCFSLPRQCPHAFPTQSTLTPDYTPPFPHAVQQLSRTLEAALGQSRRLDSHAAGWQTPSLALLASEQSVV